MYKLYKVGGHYEIWLRGSNTFYQSYDESELADARRDVERLNKGYLKGDN